jgi:putative MATE family efflux protein
MKKTTELAEANIGRLMLKYFVPAFIGVFVNALYNIVDRIFIGQGVGAEALSGISVIFPVMLIMMGFGMLIGIGAGVLVSINLGRRDHKRAEQTLGTSFVLMILVSALIMVIGFAIKKPMLQSFGATDETYAYANDYLDIILMGVVFQVVGFSLNNIIRSEGSVKTAMYSMLISAGTNLILDPIFIFGLGMGVKGAAWATVISMFVLCVWVIAHFLSSRSVIKLRKEQMVVDWQITKEIMAIGMAPFAMQIAGSFVQGLLNKRLIDFGGDLAVGAMGIINSVATMVIMTIVAINMASQPIIGFNYGAKDGKRVKDTLRYSLIAATIIAVSAFTLIEAMPGVLVTLFNRDSQELYDLTVQGLRIIILAWPLVGFQVVAGHFFQSVGKAKIAMILTLLRQVIVLLPLLLVMPGWFGLNGIWAAFPVSDAVSAMVVSVFLVREWRNLDKLGKD